MNKIVVALNGGLGDFFQAKLLLVLNKDKL